MDSRMTSVQDYIRKLAYATDKEAGLKDFLKRVIMKIPGLPSKEEALKTVQDFKEKNPSKFEKVVKEVGEQLEGVPVGGKQAFDVKRFVKNFRGLADPKVIMSVVVLMGVFNTADAGIFSKMLGKGDPKQEQTVEKKTDVFLGKDKIADAFIKANLGKTQGIIEVGGVKYGIGICFAGGRNPNFAKTIADKRTQEILPGSDVVKRIPTNVGGEWGILSISK